MSGAERIPVRLAEIVPLNDLVTRFEFERTDGSGFPPFSGGAHTVIEMRDGDRRHMNPYSLMSDPADLRRYAISVRRDDEGRGGSLFLHRKAKVGDEMTLSYPVNLFALDMRARKHLFVAGGIGITPFMSMIKQLEPLREVWELHYSARTPALATYADALTQGHKGHVHVYHDDQGEKIDLDGLLKGQALGTHIYVCGPKGMIDWVTGAAEAAGWPAHAIHSEEFLAPEPGDAFTVRLESSGKTVEVGEDESLLEALERVGEDPPYLCRGGACGQCETRVIKADGTIIHRDHWLDEEDLAAGDKIMPCVSRFEGSLLVLDR